ncbi:MAG TPA: acyl-CoA dehydrogenase family protein, partial [Actinomycetes bacterium]|nr:acyl-CoA dehydrogenase family protein [Actinomycetes bacterium]
IRPGWSAVELGDDPQEAAFRAEARAWLAEHVGPYRVGVDPDSPSIVFADVSDTAHLERGRAWQRELRAGGWAGLGWPVEHGGRDLPIPLRAVWAQELSRARVPPPINLLGEAIAGPTILAHGTEEQKRRFLPPILTAEEIWCQLFSEPDAGSDMAAVTTTAVRDGDGWRVSGHKIWTSGAHYADFAILLARTDWDVPKHRGCTYFLLDMRQPGVTTRPLRQMTGGAAFNEVFLDRARVPDDHRLGAEGDGWAVAVTTLMHERLNLGLGLARAGGGVERLLDRLRGSDQAADPLVRQVAAQLAIDARCAQYLGWRIVSQLSAGVVPGPEGSVAKLASARVSRRWDELAEAMRGAGAMVHDEYTQLQLWVPATRIAGGTDEILKNVIAERVLGLPPEPRTDKDVPFRDVARGV